MEENLFTVYGRIRRTIFWIRWAIATGINISLGLILSATPTPGMRLLVLVANVAITAFILVQGAKRMHDLGKSGWHFLIPFYNIVLAFTDGHAGPNQYGEDPKGRGEPWQCPACQAANEPYNLACIQCGHAPFAAPPEPTHAGKGDKLLVVYLLVALVNKAIFEALNSFLLPTNLKLYQQILVVANLLWVFLPLMLVFSIQKKSYRTAGIVLYVIYAVWCTVENVAFWQRVMSMD